MEQDKAIPAGAVASVIAHLILLALLVLVSEVVPLDRATEPIEVNIVSAADVAPEEPKPIETPSAALPEPTAPAEEPKPASTAQATAAPQPPPSPPQQPASPASAPPDRRAAAPPPRTQAGQVAGGYRQPEPDISVKYNVVLGLPPDLPMPAVGKPDGGFDETTAAADVSSSVIVEFRRHLKSCSKLPASVQRSDPIAVKLRVFLTQDGRLAAEPAIGGGSANVKAIELLQSAIAALKSCQPYTMLPGDRYGEWKVLDLDFTPRDFSG